MATKITGSFSGKISTQAAAALFHEDNHALTLIQVVGTQKSPDPLWNGSRITYWGTADLVNDNGPQKGYWCNEHADGDRDWGTFEGKVTFSGQQGSMEGTFKFTGGTAKLRVLPVAANTRATFPPPRRLSTSGTANTHSPQPRPHDRPVLPVAGAQTSSGLRLLLGAVPTRGSAVAAHLFLPATRPSSTRP